MKAVLQRVHSASVTVEQQLVSKIGKGVLVFAAVGQNDTRKEVESVAAKITKIKFWDDGTGARWRRNVQEIDGEILCVSQFTLLAQFKGNKPSFHKSGGGEQAKELYEYFFAKIQELYKPEKVKDGVFQAMMNVELVNDGPVTFEVSVEPPEDRVGLDATESAKDQS